MYRGYRECALAQLEKFNIRVNTKLRKGEFIFAVAKRVLADRKARWDNFRTTVQATARIGNISTPVRVCVWMPCTSRAIYACVYGWARVCVSSQSSMDAPDCLVGRYDGYTTVGSTVMHTFTVIISRGTVCPSCLVSSGFSRPRSSRRVDTYLHVHGVRTPK